jgi:4-diphosphocytidyl-2-C-methyl-D-erythritol kinase
VADAAAGAVVRVAAPAKLNLYLHVVGRRADGYHLLDTLFAFVACGDVVEAALAPDLSLAIDGPFAAALDRGGDNLVLRAARALDAGAGRGARLRLIKNLPVASGIGGGSADAAATLIALARLWRLDVDRSRLDAVARTLGADVPACLRAAPCHGGGTGADLVDAAALPSCGVVLVNPGLALSTPEVFARRRGAFSTPARIAAAPGDAEALAAALRMRRNDLTPGAIERAPEIAAVLVALERSRGCLLARMSGSGATCFGLYRDAGAAAAAATELRAACARWWIESTELVGARG